MHSIVVKPLVNITALAHTGGLSNWLGARLWIWLTNMWITLLNLDYTSTGASNVGRATGWPSILRVVGTILILASALSLVAPQWFHDWMSIPQGFDQTRYTALLHQGRWIALIHMVTGIGLLIMALLYRPHGGLRSLPALGMLCGLALDLQVLAALEIFPMRYEALLWLIMRAAFCTALILYAVQPRPVIRTP